MPTIHGNLVLKKDTTYDESLVVEGNIIGYDGVRYNLIVKGNINALDIVAGDIVAGDINAAFILCEIIKQNKGSKLTAKNVITKRREYKPHNTAQEQERELLERVLTKHNLKVEDIEDYPLGFIDSKSEDAEVQNTGELKEWLTEAIHEAISLGMKLAVEEIFADYPIFKHRHLSADTPIGSGATDDEHMHCDKHIEASRSYGESSSSAITSDQNKAQPPASDGVGSAKED